MNPPNRKGPHDTDVVPPEPSVGGVILAGAAAEPTPAGATQMNGGEELAPHAGAAGVTRTMPDQGPPIPVANAYTPPIPVMQPPAFAPQRQSGGSSSKVWIVGGGFFALGILATILVVTLSGGNNAKDSNTDKGDTPIIRTSTPAATSEATPPANPSPSPVSPTPATPDPQPASPSPATPTPGNPSPGTPTHPNPAPSGSTKPTTPQSPIPVPSWIPPLPQGIPTVIPSVFPNPFPQ